MAVTLPAPRACQHCGAAFPAATSRWVCRGCLGAFRQAHGGLAGLVAADEDRRRAWIMRALEALDALETCPKCDARALGAEGPTARRCLLCGTRVYAGLEPGGPLLVSAAWERRRSASGSEALPGAGTDTDRTERSRHDQRSAYRRNYKVSQ